MLDFVDTRMPQIIGLVPGGRLEERLHVGDFIVEVNGVRDSKFKVMGEFQESACLDVLVYRPVPFVVELRKRAGEPSGLDVEYMSGGLSLLITGLSGVGPAAEWNASHERERLLVHDRIIAVNGKGGAGEDPETLVKRLEEATRATLQVARPRQALLRSREGPRCKARVVEFDSGHGRSVV